MCFFKISFLAALSLAVSFCYAQSSQDTRYDHQELFGPVNWPAPGDARTASGKPSERYWQNRADYLIHTTLFEGLRDTTISGDVTINYTNNSPDELEYMWLQLDQNLFRPDSRGASTTPVTGDRFDVKGFNRGGIRITTVSITYKGQSYSVTPVITDARMQLRLNKALGAKGDKLQIKINYNFSIPLYGADRMGRKKFSQGYVYEIAQWYPRMCVYDDVEGWNTLPYMGLGEFYCDYGDFDYYVTAPGSMVVVGSGDLQNAPEVLTPLQLKRLADAKNSDKTVMLITDKEVGEATSRPNKETLTWHFKMENSRDIAWAASKAFIWDAAKVNFPSGRKGVAMSAYPKESAGEDAWGRSTEYLKHSMEIYSSKYFEYPWNSAVNVSGVALGMEYPGIIFCLSNYKNAKLWDDITHEIGHNWFPMIVGSNERKYMWQDEGFNTFINDFASKEFNKGEYFNANDLNAQSIYQQYKNSNDPLMTPPEAIGLNDYGQYYVKTALGLKMLRNVVLGTDRFDYAFNQYIKNWALKHPTPYDFFRAMNNAAGEDLNWFWKSWFFTTWKLDQAVGSVKYDASDNSALITIVNKEKMAMPVDLKITLSNGTSEIIQLPVNVWQRGGVWTFKYPAKSPLKSIVIDPNGELPDADLRNNEWKAN